MPSLRIGNAARGMLRGAVLTALPAGLLLLQAMASEPASAAEKSVTVKADQASIVPISGEPATVVVGNPIFAEVTIQEGMIVIHGRHFGTTNVMVLDASGNMLSEFELHVIRGGSQNLTIYKAGSSYSYLCAPACESTLQVGDNADYFASVNTEISAKHGLSTGVAKAGE